MIKPSYHNPPVVETVLGVQFPEIAGFGSVHYGLFWQTVRDRYCRVEDRPRIPPAQELFPRRRVSSELEIQLGAAVSGRVWMFGPPNETELLQIQPDRFLFNWRRGSTGNKPYPRYLTNSRRFLDEFKRFAEWCSGPGVDLMTPRPSLCEVTYVNHLMPEPGESAVELLGKAFVGLRWPDGNGCRMAHPEAVVYNRVFVIPAQRGRLYAEAQIAAPAASTGGGEFVAFHLTARVRCEAAASLDESLQLAHDWVVHGFAALTDPEIQASRWGRIE